MEINPTNKTMVVTPARDLGGNPSHFCGCLPHRHPSLAAIGGCRQAKPMWHRWWWGPSPSLSRRGGRRLTWFGGGMVEWTATSSVNAWRHGSGTEERRQPSDVMVVRGCYPRQPSVPWGLHGGRLESHRHSDEKRGGVPISVWLCCWLCETVGHV
jgi:hypothetical protein